MFARESSLLRMRSGRSLAVLFCVTILLPGVLLAVLGVRTLLQERRFAEQQLRERVDLAAGKAARDVDGVLNQWQLVLDQFGRGSDVKVETQPADVRASFAEPGAAAIVSRGKGGGWIWPAHQMLYELSPGSVAPIERGQTLAFGEREEFQSKDYTSAQRLYRHAVQSSAGPERAEALNRLARTLRKSGRYHEAQAIYEQLERLHERIGTLPVDLIARHEICALLEHQVQSRVRCALDLYRDLVGGRWALERMRYAFYSRTARDWASGDVTVRDELRRLTDIEESKRDLAQAATAVLESTQAPPTLQQRYVVFRTTTNAATALLLSKRWLSQHLWPKVFQSVAAESLDGQVADAAGDILFTSAPARTGLSTRALARAADVPVTGWRVWLVPRDAAALSSELARRQTMYATMLALVLALLVSGTYLTTRMVKKEVEIARLKSDFVAAVSHEFRSPLTGIRQLSEMLARGRVSEDRRQEYYTRITRESDRLSRLVENLLDFSRMEDGRKEYRFETLDTAAWLSGVIEDARGQHTDHHFAIIATIPEGLPPVVADRTALACAVENLIDNAVKYSPGRDTIWVDADAGNGQVTIRVRDAGIGIAEDERHRIFEKFYRGRGEITLHVKGAGLGLSLVERIVSAHRGSIRCDGRVGEGTTFSIHLPASSPMGS